MVVGPRDGAGALVVVAAVEAALLEVGVHGRRPHWRHSKNTRARLPLEVEITSGGPNVVRHINDYRYGL
jgi:hypothetical protein